MTEPMNLAEDERLRALRIAEKHPDALFPGAWRSRLKMLATDATSFEDRRNARIWVLAHVAFGTDEATRLLRLLDKEPRRAR